MVIKISKFLFLLLPFVFIALVQGCDECKDCGPNDQSEPTLIVNIFDSTYMVISHDSLQYARNLKLVYDDSLKAVKSELENDQLNEAEIEVLTEKEKGFIAEISKTNTLITKYDNLTKQLNTGVDSIRYLYSERYGDTIRIFQYKKKPFSFPLRPDADSTVYYIEYTKERKDTITFRYTRALQNVNNRIKVFAKDIEISNSTFIEGKIIDEKTVNLYY